MNVLNKFGSYGELINEVFNKKPGDVTSIIEKIMSCYPVELYDIDGKSYILLVKLSGFFYGVSWVCTKKMYRNHGYASYLLDKIHNHHKGFFVTKVGANTRDAARFYVKNGYHVVFSDDVCTVLVFINDVGVIDF